MQDFTPVVSEDHRVGLAKALPGYHRTYRRLVSRKYLAQSDGFLGPARDVGWRSFSFGCDQAGVEWECGVQ